MSSAVATGRDPYELDRLANELAIRDAKSNGDTEGSLAEHDLPLLLPLSHDHPLLSSGEETFNVDAFLLSRPNTSLSDLRAELRDYLAVLKEELVQLINDDYAAFISLRTDLRGEGPRLERLLEPLQTVKLDIDKSRGELDGIQTAIEEKLVERSALREEKTLLHLLLKVSDLVARLENMLLIPSPDDSTSQSLEYSTVGVRDMNGMLTTDGFHHPNGDDDTDEHRPTINRAKHLSRIAVEYNQLLYHAEKARRQDCVFVDQLQKRIDRIQTTLSRDLDVVFSAALLSVTSSVPIDQQSTAARARGISELSECLHIYEMLERWEAAGEVVRQDIVAPFVKKAINPGALSAPLSPLVPRTPLLDVPSASQPNGPLSPNTPFTPYPTSFSTLAMTTSLSQVQSQPSITLIDSNPDDPLVHLLNTILKFVERDCKLVIDLAERANSARSYKRYKGRIPTIQNGNGVDEGDEAAAEGFDILGGVVWAEIGRALMEDLGSSLFAAGRPDDFQKNYTIVHEFITSLEYAAPSSNAVAGLRKSSIYEAFERRWQLPVYFQLRWKEIVGGLEDSLIRPSPELSSKKGDGFFAPQARGIYHAIATCWSSTVFIPELGHRFWKLTLQILSRYETWLDSTMPVRRNSLSASTSEKNEQQQDSTEMDEAHLRAFASALGDLRNLQRKTRALFSDVIVSLLPVESVLSEDVPPAEEILDELLSRFDGMVPQLSSQIISILTLRCTEPLQHVRSIPSQYRAMSARRGPDMPTESSYFVPNILKPLREFLLDTDGPGVALQKEFGKVWAGEVFRAVCTKYTGYLSGMKKTEDSLRRYNKSKRSTFMLFGANKEASTQPGGDKESRDDVRIRAQMVLDVETLGKDAKALGAMVDVDGSEEYAELKALAAQNDG